MSMSRYLHTLLYTSIIHTIIHYQKPKTSILCQLYSKNNGPVLLFKTIFRHWNCFLPFVDTDGKDGHGVKLETTT